MNYYEHHIGDYAAATGHLSLVEDAVYTRMLRRYYLTERPLPADASQIARLVGARQPEEVAAVDAVLGEFFTLEADGWHQKRADEDIAKYLDKQGKARASADARWSGKRTQCGRNADAVPSQSEGNAHQTPDTSNHKDQKQDQKRARSAPTPAELFPDVDPDHLRDWVAARKAKRLPLTETAAKGFRRAAAKAGMTAAEAVKFCAEKGWAGLHADNGGGVNPRGSPPTKPNSSTRTAVTTLLAGTSHAQRYLDQRRDPPRLGQAAESTAEWLPAG